jgi:hypothetical protein
VYHATFHLRAQKCALPRFIMRLANPPVRYETGWFIGADLAHSAMASEMHIILTSW